jgi:hypothetical protein
MRDQLSYSNGSALPIRDAMPTDTIAIDIQDLVRRYGRTDAVNGLTLSVARGRCYGFFGGTAQARRPHAGSLEASFVGAAVAALCVTLAAGRIG